jgi:glyoxylase-like metal-dependent hydrolase (beta-lactamase superfamily II)
MSRALFRSLSKPSLGANSRAMNKAHQLSTLVILLLLASGSARAQMGDPAKVTLKTTPVAGGISVIEGANGFAGGNVAVSAGNDGVFIVDDELTPMSAKLKAAIAALSKKPVRFVINTHWHADHTGGNPAMGSAGAVIVAHDNVRKRLSVDQTVSFGGQVRTVAATPPEGLPVITFGEDVTLHLNGDDVHVIHVPPAHTDGDSIVHFAAANVIHTGDTFSMMGYPFVDASSGGKFDGLIAAADRALALCNDSTKIIPGHGPVGTTADLKAWRDMLVKIRDKVAALAAEHKSLDDIKAAKPTAEFDAKMGAGFIKPDQVVEEIFVSLPPAPEKGKGGKKAKK